jgi:hypothetical protein
MRDRRHGVEKALYHLEGTSDLRCVFFSSSLPYLVVFSMMTSECVEGVVPDVDAHVFERSLLCSLSPAVVPSFYCRYNVKDKLTS